MPRGPRLDTPGALHHVRVRGIEQRSLFHDDQDRAEFVSRLSTLARSSDGPVVYAWSLMPNHAHLLVQSRQRSISSYMRSLLTAYAVTFNRRHQRAGHLFQNRFKSTLVDTESYLLELIRYIHLNPLRAGIVADMATLDNYPWTGSARLLGQINDGWQEIDEVLTRFGRTVGEARAAYHQFVAAGMKLDGHERLQSGGLRRRHGRWSREQELQRGRERWTFDERILGDGAFVKRVLAEQELASGTRMTRLAPEVLMTVLIEHTAKRFHISPRELVGSCKSPPLVAARSVISFVAVRRAGLSLTAVGRALDVSPPTVLRAVRNGPFHLELLGLKADEFPV